MNIHRLVIKNFRNIGNEEQIFDLNTTFTVIIGINGKGKSTILNALRVACGSFFLAIPDVPQKGSIKQDEIRQKEGSKLLVPQKPVKIEATGSFPDSISPIVWRRQILAGSNTNTSSDTDVGTIRNIGKAKYQTVNGDGNDQIALPVIAFFSASRAHSSTERKLKARTGRQVFKEGYQDWYEMKSITFKYESWLTSYEILKRGGKEYDHTKQAFFTALKKANRYIEEVEEVGGKLWLKINMEGNITDSLPIHLHSDGIRFYTEMVAELAYRCIVLNGYLDADAITGSKGVVLIDELDLHLHPNWQKVVVGDLKSAFPGIQFVVTTHSPFIVQSLHSEELINLDVIEGLDEDPNRYSIEEISAYEMGVKDVERSKTFLQMQEAAAEFFDLVKEMQKRN